MVKAKVFRSNGQQIELKTFMSTWNLSLQTSYLTWRARWIVTQRGTWYQRRELDKTVEPINIQQPWMMTMLIYDIVWYMFLEIRNYLLQLRFVTRNWRDGLQTKKEHDSFLMPLHDCWRCWGNSCWFDYYSHNPGCEPFSAVTTILQKRVAQRPGFAGQFWAPLVG